MRICVTGREGQIVRALIERAAGRGLDIVTLARPDFDLAEPAGARAAIERIRPDLVVNAAAYTAVDQAESEPDLALRINGEAAGAIAAAAAARDLPVIHISTDYVFDGLKPIPYREDDPAGPTSAYGRSKLAGEIAVRAGNPRHLILRTAWVHSHEGRNFVRTMLRLAETRDRVNVVSDQFGNPSYAPDIAEAILALAPRIAALSEGDARFGTYHLAGTGDTSWAGFAAAIFDHLARRGMKAPALTPIATADYPTPAARPANSRLDCGKLADVFSLRLPHWSDALARGLDRLLAPAGRPSP